MRGKLLNAIIALFFILCTGLLASAYLSKGEGSFLGFRGFIVLTGSMNPTFDAGSYIVVKEKNAEDIQVGDILTYKVDNNTVLTHRVVEVLRDGDTYSFLTKGDANNVPDTKPVTRDRILGVAIFWVNRMGMLLMSLQQPRNLMIMFALLSAGVFTLEICGWIWRKGREG